MGETHDLSALVGSGAVTGAFSPPMTQQERRDAEARWRAAEAARIDRIDDLVRAHDLADGTVVRDGIGALWRFNVPLRGMRPNPRDAWWDTFGDEEGWRAGDECPHADRRRRDDLTCPVRECAGGPALPLEVVTR